VVFNVAWGGIYAWKLRFKLTKEQASRFKGKYWEFQTYDDTFSEAQYRSIKPNDIDIQELDELFKEAYKRVSGTD
jgi:hypothetical protein